jgi:hypothetical protein
MTQRGFGPLDMPIFWILLMSNFTEKYTFPRALLLFLLSPFLPLCGFPLGWKYNAPIQVRLMSWSSDEEMDDARARDKRPIRRDTAMIVPSSPEPTLLAISSNTPSPLAAQGAHIPASPGRSPASVQSNRDLCRERYRKGRTPAQEPLWLRAEDTVAAVQNTSDDVCVHVR